MTMPTAALHTALIATLVVLAGCAGGVGPGGETASSNAAGVPTGTAGASPGSTDAAGSPSGGGSAGGAATSMAPADEDGSISGAAAAAAAAETGTVDFYLSDRPAAIDRFDSLTVTVTTVAFHRAGTGDEEDELTTSTGSETEMETETEPTAEDEPTESTTTQPSSTPTATTLPPTERPANETETESENSTSTGTETGTPNETDGSAEEPDEPGTWITYDGAGREADLTQLRGPNATLVGNYDLPAGKYTMVRIAVESPSGVLTEGNETVSVKVPSNRLRINRPFTVEPNRSLSFVFDLTVVEAGGSGKFVLTPVIGQSGPSVPLKATNAKGAPGKAGPPTKNGSAPGNSGQAGGPAGTTGRPDAALEVDVLGQMTANQSSTLRVTAGAKTVAGATVSLDGTVVGETDDHGRITFTVPDAESVTVRVETDDRHLERTFAVDSRAGGKKEHDDGTGTGDGGVPDDGGQNKGNGSDNGSPSEDE